MHDAAGKVVAIEFNPQEKRVWEDVGHQCHRDGYVSLQYLPLCVFVFFDDFQEDLGCGVGVVPVVPHRGSWTYQTVERRTGKRGKERLKMSRCNLPVVLERVRTCQTAQGMSTDSCKM